MIKAVIFDVGGVLISLDSFLKDGEVKIFRDIFNLIERLKNNYRLGILSNTCSMHVEKLKKENVYDSFEIIVLSNETGVRKPEKEVYEHLLTRLNLLPEEVVFIDDLQENIDGANKLGINGILYQNLTQLEKDLQRLGVKT